MIGTVISFGDFLKEDPDTAPEWADFKNKKPPKFPKPSLADRVKRTQKKLDRDYESGKLHREPDSNKAPAKRKKKPAAATAPAAAKKKPATMKKPKAPAKAKKPAAKGKSKSLTSKVWKGIQKIASKAKGKAKKPAATKAKAPPAAKKPRAKKPAAQAASVIKVTKTRKKMTKRPANDG